MCLIWRCSSLSSSLNRSHKQCQQQTEEKVEQQLCSRSRAKLMMSLSWCKLLMLLGQSLEQHHSQ
jgi:hypothetical protein